MIKVMLPTKNYAYGHAFEVEYVMVEARRTEFLILFEDFPISNR